jgi:hypothetical protein
MVQVEEPTSVATVNYFTYWLTKNAVVRLGLCGEVGISKMVFDPYPDKDDRGPLDCGATVIG